MKLETPTNALDSVSTLNDALIEGLKAKSIINTPAVEAAFRAVPRHLCVPHAPLEEAYADRAIITKSQDGIFMSSSSQPAIMAIMLEQLDLKPGHKVLEIGAGTGYNAALIAHIVGATGEVTTVDIDEDIVENAKTHLSAAGFERVHVICADGGYGYQEAAPYDRIILTVCAADIMPAWWEQMKPDGRLVLPLAINEVQQTVAFEQANTHLVSVSVKRCGFMLLRGQFAAPPPPNFAPLTEQANLLVQRVENQPIDGEKIYRWLTGPSHDLDTGVAITLKDLGVVGSFRLWVTAHLPEMFILAGVDDMVERNIVPPLIATGGEQKRIATAIHLNEEGMAALMRPPDQPVPWSDSNDPFASNIPFNLYVRQLGADDSAAQQLMGVIKSWQEAGRPSTEQLQIRVYPKLTGYTPMAGEFGVDTQWNRFVLEWKGNN
ncbi:MAG: methyltransferase, FxLD system [Caldilineaceae bacterium]